MIVGTWGYTARCLLGDRGTGAQGDAVCYLEGEKGRFIVVMLDGTSAPSVVNTAHVPVWIKLPGQRWKRDK